ncbi:MAG: ATP phosphoribosyltransferase [Peptococcaceae bacterium]|nr:ATP phosphoribosyltransferase [Peptococcaceae bacterium]
MRPIRIALTKGRLEEKSIEMFEQLGYDCSEVRNKGRRLVLPIKNANIEIILAKAADVITYVENGVCDLGVVGKDTIMENGGTFYEVADLGFGRCRFALAVPAGADFYQGYHTRCIASKYVNVTRNYFEKKNMDVDIVKIEGSVELAPILGLSDAIVDIVETGTTLKENGLVVTEEVCKVSARLIVNIASMKLRKAEINELITKIESYVEEREAQKKAKEANAQEKGAEQA